MSRAKRVEVVSPEAEAHHEGNAPQLVKLSVLVPIEAEIRLHGLARCLGMTKRELATKFLVQGLERYQEDRRLKRVAAEMVGQDDAAA